MKKYLFLILISVIILGAETLFEVRDEAESPVIKVSTDGLRILNLSDTLMVITQNEIKAITESGKGLSRAFVISSSYKGADRFRIDSLTMTLNGPLKGTYLNLNSNNIFMGINSGTSTSSGLGNAFIGNYAGMNNQTGNNNVFIGESAGRNYNGSFGNVLIGEGAAENLATGMRNLIMGYNAGAGNAGTYSCDANVFLGAVAGRYISGSNNVIIGESAGENYQPGGSSGYNNVFVGSDSGRFSTGHDNIYLGYGAGGGDYSNPHIGYSNIYIGNNAGSSNITESNKLRIGNLLWGDLSFPRQLVVNGESSDNINTRTFFVNGSAGGDYAWWNDSDERLKKNISTIENSLEKVMNLRGVTYEWKDENSLEKGRKMGFIAQEAIQIIPEAVDYNVNKDRFSMQYSTITAVLVEAVKEQNSEIKDLKAENLKMKQELEKIKQLLKITD